MATAATPSSRSSHPTSSRRTSSRAKGLLIAAPLLALVYLLVTRTSPTQRPLPSHFAVCSPTNSPLAVLTLDDELRTQCIVVNEGIIVGRGSLSEVREEWGDVETLGSKHGRLGGLSKIVYLRQGEALLPGLIDAHAHVLQYGEAKSAVDLVGSTSVAEIVERIASFVEKDPALKQDRSRFVLGLGWDQTKFAETKGAFPTARIDVHALWVSPAILKLLPSDLPKDVPGGEIVRLADGKPSGVFLDNAMNYIIAVIPPWTDLSRLSFLRRTTTDMLSAGLTGVHDAALSPADIAFFRTLDEGRALKGEKPRARGESRLPVRLYGMVGCEPTNSWCGDEVERYEGERFSVRAAKIFTDGALGSWGAAMLEPYSDAPDKTGILISPAEDIQPLVEKWIAKGFQVNSHGIGDRANRVILDAYENVLRNLTSERTGKALEEVTDAELRETQKVVRLRNEHSQIMTPEDLERMGRLGIVASFQPTHATSDMGYAESRLGPVRIKGAYAWRTLIDGGAPFALGSDFPVEGVNPFLGIYAAVARKWVEGPKAGDSPHGKGGWYSSQHLTPLEALQGFTTATAWASFSSHQVGALEIGKFADFIVVNGDPLVLGQEVEGESDAARAAREKKLREMKVKATVVEGRLVHGAL
ncbi:hypothetical protein JCM10207_002671 [Rhodosporidiobolus poonsookiae]